MFHILKKQSLTANTDLLVIEAPEIARRAAPGQFVILRKDETSERIPLTIADFDRVNGAISVIFEKGSQSTRALGELHGSGTMHSIGTLHSIAGPLGKASDIRLYGRVVLAADGAGAASIYPIARALYEANTYVTVIMGARSSDMLIWEERLNAVCDEIFICTDDGTRGRKGPVVNELREQLEARWVTSRAWAIGPAAMMKSCCEVARLNQTPITVNLASIMVDGAGLCGSCRVEVDGDTRFVCMDGPEFDGLQVNWDSLMAPKKTFVPAEQHALHLCQQMQTSSLTCALDQVAVQPSM